MIYGMLLGYKDDVDNAEEGIDCDISIIRNNGFLAASIVTESSVISGERFTMQS